MVGGTGTWGACGGEILPTTETCNGIDDDCDGTIDEGVTQSCYTGPSGTQGVGACRAGTQTCVVGGTGTWGACAGQVLPAAGAAAATRAAALIGKLPRAAQTGFHALLRAYGRRSGTAALINTSFNVHEEPIINRPEEALRALKEDRVDHLLSAEAVWSRAG